MALAAQVVEDHAGGVDAVAHGQHQGGLRAVDAVAGGHLLGARLQEVLLGHPGLALGLLQHAEE